MVQSTFTTSYVDPDLDGVACAIAYAEFLNATGQSTSACIMGHPTAEAEFALLAFSISRPEEREAFALSEKVIILDASELKHFEGRLAPEQVMEVIDHRKMNEAEKFTNAKIHIELVGAAATLVAEKFREAGIEPTMSSAKMLQAAIISNTQNFQAGTTTDRDHAIMHWLGEIAPLPANFTHDMFAAKSDFAGEKLARAMDIETAIFEIAGKRLGIVQLEMIGSEALVRDRQDEMLGLLDRLRGQNHLDHIFLTMLDVEEKCNRFLTSDLFMQSLLSTSLDLEFEGALAMRAGIIMRKEMMPRLKEHLEHFR